MDNLIGNLCVSVRGRDAENVYFIYAHTGNNCFLVDGNAKKIVNPKKKNIKHIKLLGVESTIIKEKIAKNQKVFDSEIYSFIKNYKNC
ncbi:MAG: hypothetical protein ACI4TI_02485 [Christensenellales bacterium]